MLFWCVCVADDVLSMEGSLMMEENGIVAGGGVAM